MKEKENKIADEQEMKSQTDSKTDNKAEGKEEMADREPAVGKEKPKKKRGGSRSKKKEAELEARLQEIEEKNAELNDKYLRLFSEFDNFRKRTMKEKAEFLKNASEEMITTLLPVVDDFERALQTFKDDEDNAHKEGMELIYNKLINILKSKGVTVIAEKEVDFDTDIHEAITKIPAPSEALKGKVVDIIEKGYKLNDKVIRYAKVVIGE